MPAGTAAAKLQKALDRTGIFLSVKVAPEGEKGRRVDISEMLISFTFEDNDTKADKMTLTIDNWDLSEFDNPIWRKGAMVEAAWGYAELKHPPVRCVIQSVKGGQEMKVECLAKSLLMSKVKKARTFNTSKPSDVALKIAEEYGYSGAGLHVEDSTATKNGTISQAGRTDAQFLASLAKQLGFQFYVDWSGFHFHQRNVGQPPRKVREWMGGDGDVKSFDVENDIAARAGSVGVSGRNPLTRKDFTATADNAKTKRAGLAPNPEAQGSGYEINAASGEISLKRLVTHEATKSAAPTEAAAKKQADGSFRQTSLGTVKLKLGLVFDPGLVAKSVETLQRFGNRLSGNYYVHKVTTKLGAGDIGCDAEYKRDGHSEKGTPSSKASVNSKTAPKDANQLGLAIRPRGGEVTTTWRDTHGVAVGGPSDIPQQGPTKLGHE